MKKYALIMAGGEGRRAGDELPKQFHKLLGIPMLWWSVKAFHKENKDTEIRVVMHPDYFEVYERLRSELPDELKEIPVKLTAGGKSRGESVKKGLDSVPSCQDILVAVHDAARPLISTQLISKLWNCALINKTALPVKQVTDSLREIYDNTSKPADRNKFVIVQTPQVFRADIIKEAYNSAKNIDYTDDASLVQHYGTDITLCEGETENFKVTYPSDFIIAEILLKRK